MDQEDCKPVQHAKYFFQDGSLIIRVEDTLYNLHREFLKMKSCVLCDMFSMPLGNNNSIADGQSIEKPVILPHISEREFNELLSFLYHEWHPPPDTAERLLALLKLGNLYEIDDAKAYAMASLQHHPDVHPSLRLHVAQKYSIKEWLGPAFRRLMAIPLSSLSSQDTDLLGLHAYTVLSVTKEKVGRHRREVAQSFPVIHLPYRHPNCYRGWSATWWTEIGTSMLSLREPFSWSKTVSRIAAAEMPMLCESCKPRYAHEVQEQGKGWEDVEEAIIEEAIASLL